MTATLPRQLLSRADAEAFFEQQSERYGIGLPSVAARWMHAQLLNVTSFGGQALHPKRRELAITTCGVPVVYSHKCTQTGQPARFRILAEPGGTHLTVAEQVLVSRDLFERICDYVGWQRAREQVNAVLSVLLPSDEKDFSEWHGGLGFGLEIGNDCAELRLYCNVRHGSLVSRWQRFADAVGEFADDRAKPVFRELLDRALPLTIPAGLALAIGEGEVRGIRLYCGLVDATSESTIAAGPPRFAEFGTIVHRLVDSYRASLGELGEQDITLGFDFAIRDGLLWPCVARYKVDLRCEPTSQTSHPKLIAWAEHFLSFLSMDGSSLRRFDDELEIAFCGSTVQYVSVGLRDGAQEFSAYCIPGRHAH
jgi:hypothetical protein